MLAIVIIITMITTAYMIGAVRDHWTTENDQFRTALIRHGCITE